MFLSELKEGDRFCLSDEPLQDYWKVDHIETDGYLIYSLPCCGKEERKFVFTPNTFEVFKVITSLEIRARNVQIKMFIKVKPTPPNVVHGIDFNFPVGHITYPMVNVEKMEGHLLPEGQALKKEEYPELYAAIGDSYTQTREIKEFPLNGIEKVKKLFKIKFTPRTYFVETRNCGEDEFRIPDLRAQIIR